MKKRAVFVLAPLLCIAALSLLNAVLAVALLVLFVLSALTFLLLKRFRFLTARIAILFLVVLFVHLAATLVIHYANFYPFGGGEGDQWWYHKAGVEISDDFRRGDFSFDKIDTQLEENGSASSYPVFLAILYTVTVPDKLVGKMLSVWLVGLSALVLYALSRELGSSDKFAFLVGVSPVFYPSYLYWGGLLLRESLVVVLVLLSVLLIVKIQKRFSFGLFFLFYLVLGALIHFRFYPGLAVLFVFLLSWFFLFNLNWRKKLLYGLLVIPLLGFLPQIEGRGYYGFVDIRHFTEPQTVAMYRENLPGARQIEIRRAQPGAEVSEQYSKNLGSTVIIEAAVDDPVAFIKNYLVSFSFMLLGPFPWHIRYARQLFVLAETIPWLVAFFFIVKGVMRSPQRWKTMMPVVLVSMGILAEIALILNTYGTYMRIRMPSFLLLLTLLPFAFEKEQKDSENTLESAKAL